MESRVSPPLQSPAHQVFAPIDFPIFTQNPKHCQALLCRKRLFFVLVRYIQSYRQNIVTLHRFLLKKNNNNQVNKLFLFNKNKNKRIIRQNNQPTENEVMKNCALLCALGTLSLGAYNLSAAANKPGFNFYGGLQAGGAMNLNAIDEKNNQTDLSSKYNAGANGGTAGIFGGFNYVFQNTLFAGVALEADYYFLKHKSEILAPFGFTQGSKRTLEVQVKESFGADVTFGKVLDGGSSVFLGIGPRLTHMKAQQNMFDNTDPLKGEVKKRVMGVSISAGFDVPLDDHVSLGLALSHQRYGSMTLDGRDNMGITTQSKISPSISKAAIRLKFS